MPKSNILYLNVLPLVYVNLSGFNPFRNLGSPPGGSDSFFGSGSYATPEQQAEQVLTVFPDKNFATKFFPDEVERYIQEFAKATGSLVGGHVVGYSYYKEPTDDGRVIVKVIQNVE
jgi:hypothetical protein